MACFLAPGTEAIVVTAVAQVMIAKEKKAAAGLGGGQAKAAGQAGEAKLSFAHKLMWLANLLWGGVFLLAYEHLWHGEVVPFFPFLTAMNDPGETQVMLSELASVGGTMCLFLTAVWALMLIASSAVSKRKSPLGSAA